MTALHPPLPNVRCRRLSSLPTRLLAWLCGTWLCIAWCGSSLAAEPPPGQFPFPAAGVSFQADFPAARLDDCRQIAPDEYHLEIRPETVPINNSAWYAFKVLSQQPRSITAVLTYRDGSHRYRPKVSRDGRSWSPLEADRYRVERQPSRAVLRLDVGPQPLWVAGQELITAADFDAWLDRLAARPAGRRSEVGESLDGRPLWQLTVGDEDADQYVLVIGRQHPPEVTGTIALMAFLETVTGDGELAGRFRNSWQVRAVPLMNPDGVQAGYWRCNLKRVDLNRDWDMFRQPETRAVRDEVRRLAEEGRSLRLLLDFHSTHHDVFYVQTEDEDAEPEVLEFTRKWLDGLQQQLPDYAVRREPWNPRLASAMNWGYREFRIPAITYEVGDNTDRQRIRTVAAAAAREMMRLLTSDAAGDFSRSPDPRQAVPAAGPR